MKKVLVIDDKIDNLISISALLNKLIPDCKVYTAQNGLDGIEMVKIKKPDTILLDIQMPGIDGYEVCKQLKSDNLTKHIPIVLLTAIHTELQNKVYGLEIGADAFLTKPIDEGELVAQVSAMMRIKLAEDSLRKENINLEAKVKERTIKLVEKIQEKNRIAEELTTLSQNWKTTFNTISDCIVVLDNNRQVLLYNEAAQKQSKLDSADICGNNCSKIMHDSTKIAFYDCPYFKMLKSKQKESYLYTHNKKWYRCTAEPDFDKNMDLKSSVVVVSDVTNQINIEKELTDALEKAQEGERLKTAFLANMSHEIRTPMNGINGFSEMIVRPNITREKQIYCAGIIRDSTKQLLNIVNDLVDISKIEAGIVKTRTEKSILNDLIDNLYSDFLQQAADKKLNVSVKKELSDNDSTVFVDEYKLTQILSNLINNAIKFTHEGEIEFGYTIESKKVQFFVRDTGIGIVLDNYKKIFKSFMQVESSMSRQYGGTGLGLSIAKAYTELLKGEIWLESELDKGTTFYFTIPFKPVMKMEEQATEVFDTIPDWTGFNMLIVEDDRNNYLLLREIIIETNAKILYASNGIDAIKYCETNEIDIVLMDLKMSKMDGYEATEKIKIIKPNLPVIAQTAYVMDSDIEKAKKAGCDDYIAKPIEEADLYQKISYLLKNN